MKLLPKTIEGRCAKKRLFMRLITKEPDPEQAEVYENAIDYCDRKVGQVHKVNCKIFIITLACLILSIGGCNTVRSTLNLGKSIGQDGAWILGKMSDNISIEEK